MNQPLHQFIHGLHLALLDARRATARQCSGIALSSMSMTLQVTVEPGDAAPTLALRLVGRRFTWCRPHVLSIEVPTDPQAIVVRFDGQLLARYRRQADEPRQ
jgi:hypothetical protein